jgi:RNA polymerase sigma-32 factor
MAKKKPASKSEKPTKARKVEATLVDDESDVEPRFEPEGPEESLDTEPVEVKALVTTGERGLVSSDPLVTYLNEIRKYNLLTREQEFEIAKKYFETKDPAAAQELIKSNLRFVVKIAAEYSRFSAKMLDLIQEGNVGLMHAVKEYNPYKGARLITYAVWWIRGYIQEYLMKQFSMVKIGTTPNQLSERLGIPVEEIHVMQNRLNYRDVSLDKPLDADGDVTLQDVQKRSDAVPVDEQIAQNEMVTMLKSKIEEIRPHLNEKEKIILEERLLNDEPLTLQEIGEKYGITREAVRQAEVRLMKKIKDKMGVTEVD